MCRIPARLEAMLAALPMLACHARDIELLTPQARIARPAGYCCCRRESVHLQATMASGSVAKASRSCGPATRLHCQCPQECCTCCMGAAPFN